MPATKSLSDKERLRRDRLIGWAMVALIVAVTVLLFWLASVAPMPTDYEYQYWLMP